MKLAEALAERANIQTRLKQLATRAQSAARIQEGDEVVVDPEELNTEVERLWVLLYEYITRINATNASTTCEDERTIADLIAQRDMAALRHRHYRDLAEAGMARHDRYSHSEVKFVATVDVLDLHRRADAAAKEYRELDTRLQQINWTVDLI